MHFTTPGSSTLRGLGFSVSAREEEVFVGHGGSCPGFRSQFSMQNEDKIAVVVMVNATVSPNKYLYGIYDLVKEALLAEAEEADSTAAAAPTEAEEADSPSIDFEKYLGTYTGGLGGDETVVVPWGDGIGTIGFPSDNPSVRTLEHVEGDTFRRPGSEGRPGSEVIFDTDEDGRVIRMRTPLNYRNRVR